MEELEQTRKVKIHEKLKNKIEKGAFFKVENFGEKWKFKRTSQSCNFSFPPLGPQTNRNSNQTKIPNKSKP
jgi:hypothetical protein